MSIGKQQGIHLGLTGVVISDGRKIYDLNVAISGGFDYKPDAFTLIINCTLTFKGGNCNIEPRIFDLAVKVCF